MNPLCFKNPDSYKNKYKELQFNNKRSRKSIKKAIESASKYFKFNKLENEIRNTKK